MSNEQQPKRMSLGERLAKKEPIGEADQITLSSFINELDRLASLGDHAFDMEMNKRFVSPYENLAHISEEFASAVQLAISAMRDSASLEPAKIRRLERLEEWIRSVRN